MVKRIKNEVYSAFGEYIVNDNPDFLNEEQLEIAKEHRPYLKKLIKKWKREKRIHSIKAFFLKIPEYMLEGVYFIFSIITAPFEFLADKCDDLRVKYGNRMGNRIKLSKNERKINDYSYNTVLPLLMEKEKDDGLYQKQREYVMNKRNNKI
ncbi:hypothetical protein SEP1_124 [Staphylococcus phage phiIBB-SEP1]|uniref:Uncharacterized protein n=1 Tax=Staphylococcus phage phiIBB-SEP1 TaxID=1340769 RepID=W5R9I0_9CAUD|nr:hypothetical protein FDH45_gp122 [Staphylococcus phage phiIBB-SEP1]AGR48250.1 hypothetical protein SEP1_124 [Staphylococcus phage phiIBB-SEP1]AXF38636.1 hypothetical protein Twillingate_203 [Staphylococcus phage Twillingate]MDU1018347.1 hypothetical protein [Clostridium perfringens]